jgi:hypothetical protein
LPNIKSAKKRVKTNKRDEIKNRTAKATLKTALKKIAAAIETGDKEAAGMIPVTQGMIARTWKHYPQEQGSPSSVAHDEAGSKVRSEVNASRPR